MSKFLMKRAFFLLLLGLGCAQLVAVLLSLLCQIFVGAWKPYLSTIIPLSISGGLVLAIWVRDKYEKKH